MLRRYQVFAYNHRYPFLQMTDEAYEAICIMNDQNDMSKENNLMYN
jgi:hypothetical protein